MKKTFKFLRIFLLAVSTLLLIGTGYFYFGFNYYSFDDEYTVEQNNLRYFNNSYVDARADFRSLADKFVEKYPSASLFNIKVDSKIDNDLTTDVCFIPGDSATEKLLIISSGVHGVEGYVGSAVQLFFMENYLTEELLSKTSILLIHSMNPYGFKYTRRVTENNVDLNRNSDISNDLYSNKNEGYSNVYGLINPEGKADHGSFGNQFFFVKAIKEIVKASMPVLRQAVLQGQYDFPKGLYFGGKDAEPQIKKLAPILDSICAPYQTIMAIDLHTGYGARGMLHLFPNPVAEDIAKRTEAIFEGFQIDWGDSDNFYTITGDFVGYIGKINKGKTFIPMAFEYGTMDSQKTIGSLKSIHIMILENQGEQNGFKEDEDKKEIKKDLLEMYYPSSESWRSHIIDETKKVLDKSLVRFTEL